MSTNSSSVEHVLVVPTSLFHEVGYFQGFQPNIQPYLEVLLNPAVTSYRPRDVMEQDPSFKQLIPYCIFRCDGQIFSYRRGQGQGETRLLKKRSVGIGGHISSIDQHAPNVYREAMRREIEEEVFLESNFQETCIGLINDDLTEVGKVHLGIVHLIDIDEPKVRPREESIHEAGFAKPSELILARDQFETWSQICLEHLIS